MKTILSLPRVSTLVLLLLLAAQNFVANCKDICYRTISFHWQISRNLTLNCRGFNSGVVTAWKDAFAAMFNMDLSKLDIKLHIKLHLLKSIHNKSLLSISQTLTGLQLSHSPPKSPKALSSFPSSNFLQDLKVSEVVQGRRPYKLSKLPYSLVVLTLRVGWRQTCQQKRLFFKSIG